jgi:hypothetical protein
MVMQGMPVVVTCARRPSSGRVSALPWRFTPYRAAKYFGKGRLPEEVGKKRGGSKADNLILGATQQATQVAGFYRGARMVESCAFDSIE